jgi:hypothetical protein
MNDCLQRECLLLGEEEFCQKERERERERERFSSEQENVKTDFSENRFLGESSRPGDGAAGVVFFLGFRVCKQQAAHERLQLMMRF